MTVEEKETHRKSGASCVILCRIQHVRHVGDVLLEAVDADESQLADRSFGNAVNGLLRRRAKHRPHNLIQLLSIRNGKRHASDLHLRTQHLL